MISSKSFILITMTILARFFIRYFVFFSCRYSHNIEKMSAILKDEPVKPIDKAIWNIEHVLKFPDAQHFRYHGKDTSFFNYYGTIVFIFGFIVTFICIFLLLFWISATILKRYMREMYDEAKKME